MRSAEPLAKRAADRRPADADEPGDLAQGLPGAAEPTRTIPSPAIEDPGAPEDRAPAPRRGEPVAGAFPDQVALRLLK